MEEIIKHFLAVNYGYGDGYGDGYGYGYGDGNGDGYGYGDGYGDGDGDGDGYGYGYGDGNGNGDGNGYGDGYGNGYGYGYGYGDGYGNGYGNGIKEICGYKVYRVDNIPTIIESVHGNYAKGYTLQDNVNMIPCYIAKCGDSFSHGKTLHEAQADAEAKYMQNMPLVERISHTIAKYPSLDTIVSNRELFALHNLLTGSCRYGREQFCARHGISLNDSMTMQEFIDYTRADYGCDAIIKLERTYKERLNE